jgi:hypothetical protein
MLGLGMISCNVILVVVVEKSGPLSSLFPLVSDIVRLIYQRTLADQVPTWFGCGVLTYMATGS